MAHASLDAAFVLNSRGEITHVVKAPADSTITNVAFRPGTNRLVLTASSSGVVLEAELPAPGVRLFSHL